jgi:transcriptional regulator with XRE-family HTH domain
MDSEERRVLERIGNAVERVRQSRGLSSADLAERSSLSLPEIEAVLGGEKDVSLYVIFRLAGALEVTPAELLQGIEWIPDEEDGGGFRVGRPLAD